MPDELTKAVRRLLDEGVSQREVVRRLGASKGAVWRVTRGKDPHATPARVEARRPLLLDPTDAAKLAARVLTLEAGLAEVREAIGRLGGKA